MTTFQQHKKTVVTTIPAIAQPVRSGTTKLFAEKDGPWRQNVQNLPTQFGSHNVTMVTETPGRNPGKGAQTASAMAHQQREFGQVPCPQVRNSVNDTTKPPQIVMVGAFPPPVTGMATTNAAMRDKLQAFGVEMMIINVETSSLDRSMAARLGRLPPVLRGLARLAGLRGPRPRRGPLYMSISGGWGQIYEIAFVALARLRRMPIFLRHCSFAYLDTPSRTTRALIKIAGLFAVHVTQSQGMADRLKDRYGAIRVVPISNAVLYPPSQTAPMHLRRKLETLGFLSNISAEKGVFEFLDLMNTVEEKNLPLKAKLAGPFQDARTEHAVLTRLQKLHSVEYVGPVYGSDKDNFLNSIDALIFPTRYKNETEAKVNHEAMRVGIPVVAYGRGCIPEIIAPGCGLVIDPAAPFVPAALAQIEVWISDPTAFEATSGAAAQGFAKTYADSFERWAGLLAEIAGWRVGNDLHKNTGLFK